MVDLFIFSENKNTVNIANNIFMNTQSLFNVKFITYDWTGKVLDWVNSVKTFNEKKFENIYHQGIDNNGNLDRLTLQAKIQKDMMEYFSINKNIKIIVFFSDASVRGYALSLAAQKSNLYRVLIQDGHLDFITERNNLKDIDQNYYYGATSPQKIYVWGNALKERIVQNFGVDKSRICVSGKVGGFIKKTQTPTYDELRILWADQPLIDQKKINKEQWLDEIKKINNVLSNYNTTIKIHPSTTESTKKILKENLIGVRIDDSNFITDLELSKYNIVITYFSSIYEQALRVGIPVIFYNLSCCKIWMPTIYDKMLKNCSSIDELKLLLKKIKETKKFHSNEFGVPLTEYIKPNDSKNIIIQDLLSINIKYITRIEKQISKNEKNKNCSLNNSISELIFNNIPKSILIISHDFQLVTGVAKSILLFGTKAEQKYGINISYFMISSRTTKEELIKISKKFNYIIINSVASFFRFDCLFSFYEQVKYLKYIYVYIHESPLMFKNAFDKKSLQVNVKKFLSISNNLFFFFVSDRQKQDLFEFGLQKGIVVGNCFASNRIYPKTNLPTNINTNKNTYKILMIGSIQPRKGVELFSIVSTLASKKNLKLQFLWVGKLTNEWQKPIPYNISFLGEKTSEEVNSLIESSDVVFISSKEESFSLVALEAALLNKRIVAYKYIGITEYFKNIQGFVTFDKYTAEAALNAIEDALYLVNVDTRKAIYKFSDVVFTKKILLFMKFFREDARLRIPFKFLNNKVDRDQKIKTTNRYFISFLKFFIKKNKIKKFNKDPRKFFADAPFYISWMRHFI